MGRHKLENRKSNLQLQHEFQDRCSSIDIELNEAFENINWNRRNNAESDIVEWVKTYCIGLLLEDEPPEKGCEVLRQMYNALNNHNNYMILMGRGNGKSVYELSVTLMAMCTAIQKYIVIVSHDSKAANSLVKDLWRMIIEPDTTLSQDYPEVCMPYQLAHGSYRRKQLYNGFSTEISKASGEIVFPTLRKSDCSLFPTSGITMVSRGITSGIRGLRKGTQRPTAVLLDDIQDSESASNPEQVRKMYDIIRKDLIPLAGKERISLICTATPICVDDLVQKLKDDKSWQTTLYPSIISFPNDMELWNQYFKIFDDESIDCVKHAKSLDFYKSNRESMESGSEVFNPTRFSPKDGHISAIQKLLEIRHEIGNEAFLSEYQMTPQKYQFALEISPKDVVKNQIDVKEGIVPDGYQFVIASSDLNLSFCVSTTLIAFKVDGTAHVIKHIFRKCHIGGIVADAEYNKKVYDLLVQHGKEIYELGIPVKGWAIDCNGLPFDAVTSFCNNSIKLCGLRSCGFIGKAAHLFNPNVRSRIRTEINKTVLCGDAQEQLKSGSGKKYVFWDSDYYREKVQNAFLSHIGNSGCMTLYSGESGEHTDYAMQICAEKLKLKRNRQDGRTEYYWKSSNDHDMLDSTAQAFACASQFGISSTNFNRRETSVKRMSNTHKQRQRIRIV